MVASPNPSFEPKTHRWCPGAGAPSREVPSQNCAFSAPKLPFLAKKSSKTHSKRPNEGKPIGTFHVRLNRPLTKNLLLPSSSTICRRNGPKMAKNGLNVRCLCPASLKQEQAVSWATWLKTEFRGHITHPQPPTFCGFQASKLPNETPRPPYQWSLGGAREQHNPRMVGANNGSTGVPGAKKMILSKVVPRPLGMLKQVFLGQFEPVVARFGPTTLEKMIFFAPWTHRWPPPCAGLPALRLHQVTTGTGV